MQNSTEVGAFLGKVQLNDGRKVDEGTIKFWGEALAKIPLEDALAALLEHQTTSTEWVTPAHILRLLKPVWEQRKRDQRIAEAKQRAIQGTPAPIEIPKCAKHPSENIASCRFCFPRKSV